MVDSSSLPKNTVTKRAPRYTTRNTVLVRFVPAAVRVNLIRKIRQRAEKEKNFYDTDEHYQKIYKFWILDKMHERSLYQTA